MVDMVRRRGLVHDPAPGFRESDDVPECVRQVKDMFERAGIQHHVISPRMFFGHAVGIQVKDEIAALEIIDIRCDDPIKTKRGVGYFASWLR